MFSCIIIFCETGAFANLLSHPIPICQQFLLFLPSEYIPNPTTSNRSHCYNLIGATRISRLDNHLLTGLSAFTLGLPKVSSQHTRQADPASLLKSKLHFKKPSQLLMILLYLNTAFHSKRRLMSSQWPTVWLLSTTIFLAHGAPAPWQPPPSSGLCIGHTFCLQCPPAP